MKPTANIRIVHDLGFCLIGEVTNHPSQERFRTKYQQTSNILARHPDGTIETRNTLYTPIMTEPEILAIESSLE